MTNPQRATLPRLSLFSLFLLAGCGGNFGATLSAPAPQAPDKVYDCLRAELRTLGYNQTSNDTDARRLAALKYDWQTKIADTTFRRIVERLTIQATPGTGEGSALTVEAHTFAEFTTQRGPTEIERPASDAVKAAAAALIERCGR